MDKFIRMPKVELHAHLNGSLDADAIDKLVALKRKDEPDFQGASDAQRTIIKDGPKGIDEVFQLFPLVQQLVDRPPAVHLATSIALRTMADDGVVYVELRSTPKCNPRMTKTQYIMAMIDAVREMGDVIVCKLLISFDRRRGVRDADDTLNVVEQLLKDGHSGIVVGIDLSGPPNVDGVPFIPALQRAKRLGLKLTLHLAEVDDSLDELELLLPLADRIGHGTFLDRQASSRQVVADKKIPIEICLTSNIIGSTVSTFESHHVKDWWMAGHPIAICTDDFGIFNTSLSKEYEIFSRVFGVSDVQMVKMAEKCLDFAFAKEEDLKEVRAKFRKFVV